MSIAMNGLYVYVADGGIGLKVIEIRDPFHPVLVGTYDITGNILGVAVSGRYVFVADGYSGIRIMRVIPHALPFCDLCESLYFTGYSPCNASCWIL